MPSGVRALPRFAATVCNTMTGTASLPVPVCSVSNSVNGTKVISATSLVISIAAKKQTPISTAASVRVFLTFCSSHAITRSKSPACPSAATTSISESSSASTRQSIYARYPAPGGIQKAEPIASTSDTVSTGSRAKTFHRFFSVFIFSSSCRLPALSAHSFPLSAAGSPRRSCCRPAQH